LLRESIRDLGVEVKVPPREYCTDNAAMIAAVALGDPGAAVEVDEFAGLDAYPSGTPSPT
jgi:tRNA A37 threonylcarbamoyltransferase TsaD